MPLLGSLLYPPIGLVTHPGTFPVFHLHFVMNKSVEQTTGRTKWGDFVLALTVVTSPLTWLVVIFFKAEAFNWISH